jgi:hypothetical protein
MALTFPNIIPDNQTFGIEYNTQVSSSTLSGIIQTVELPGARWKGTMSFKDMTPADSAELKAFLLELRGSSGRFYINDLSHTEPFLTVTGSPTVSSAPTAYRVIRATTTTNPFSVGDYIQIGTDTDRELKMIIDATQFSGLTYDYTVEPMIRRTDYIGQTITYSNPTGKFMLDTSDQAMWGIRSKALLSDINISFIEAFS